jgi:hypothetical protein
MCCSSQLVLCLSCNLKDRLRQSWLDAYQALVLIWVERSLIPKVDRYFRPIVSLRNVWPNRNWTAGLASESK